MSIWIPGTLERCHYIADPKMKCSGIPRGCLTLFLGCGSEQAISRILYLGALRRSRWQSSLCHIGYPTPHATNPQAHRRATCKQARSRTNEHAILLLGLAPHGVSP